MCFLHYEHQGKHREAVHAGRDYKQAFMHLFLKKKKKKKKNVKVNVNCCAQLAGTEEKIHERKKSKYIRS
jgi:hypothetical protein